VQVNALKKTPNEVYYQAANNLAPKGEKELPKAS